MNVTYEDVRNSEEIRTYIKQADESLKVIGYTEHSFAHCTKVANYYYVHKKTLVSRKNTEKLQNLVRQKENWKYFIRKCFGSYPF